MRHYLAFILSFISILGFSQSLELKSNGDFSFQFEEAVLSTSAKYAATISRGLCQLWDVESGKELRRWPKVSASKIQFSPDERSLVTLSYGGVDILNLYDTVVTKINNSSGTWGRAFIVSRDGKRVITTGYNDISVLYTAEKSKFSKLSVASEPAGTPALSKDDSTVYFGTIDGSLYSWKPENKSPQLIYKHNQSVHSFFIYPDDAVCGIINNDRSVDVIRLDGSKIPKRVFSSDQLFYYAIEYIKKTDELIIAGLLDNRIVKVPLSGGANQGLAKHASPVRHIKFSNGILMASSGSTIKFSDPFNDVPLSQVKSRGGSSNILYSSKQELVLLDSGEIRSWNLRTNDIKIYKKDKNELIYSSPSKIVYGLTQRVAGGKNNVMIRQIVPSNKPIPKLN